MSKAVEIKIRPGLTRLVYLKKVSLSARSVPVFKPIRLKHAEKGGSPLLHSRKEVNQYLTKKGLWSKVFSD